MPTSSSTLPAKAARDRMHSAVLRDVRLPTRPRLAHISNPVRRPLHHRVYAFTSSGLGCRRFATATSPSMGMFQRANSEYKAKAPAAPPAKAPFTSSNASIPPSLRNGNIASSFRPNRDTVLPSAGSRSGSSNTMARPPVSTSVTSFAQPSSTFASLYNKSESFEDEPARSSGKIAATNSAEIYFDENDFSDDDNLDLEFECPGSLPIVPPAPRPQPTAQEPSFHDAPANPIPWTSSPPNHLYPPQETARRPKRESTESTAPGPRPKKRTLPRGWKDDPILLDDVPERPHEPAVTPAANPKRAKLPWDTTQRATEEQRRHFKIQTKKSEPNDSLTTEDMQAAVGSHAASKKSAAISLSSEQQHVLDLVMNKGQSVFFTGPAGTGKSVLMRAIIAEMKKKWVRDPERLGITASTGLAACNIGGMTLHSFSGIGLGKEDVATLVKKIRRNPKAKNRWLRTRVLVIDEISMVDGELFDKLAQIARTIRNNGRPWGGIQLIITGDFFQLPPVPERDKSRDAKFAFDAATWSTSIDHTIGLTQVFRQRDPGKPDPICEFLLTVSPLTRL